MVKVPKIEARTAIFVIDELRRRGIPTDDLLAEVGLRRADLADPEARVSYAALLRLIERGAALADDSGFGLRLGSSRDLHDGGLIAYVVLNSSTLMDALENLRRYFRVVGEGEEFEIERGGPHVTLRFRETDPRQRGLRHNSDYIAALLVRACRDLTRRRISPLRAEFIHRRPNARIAYADLLGCPVRFDADWDALVWPAETMQLKVVDADDRLLRALQGACRRILGPVPKKQDLVRDVRELIVDRLAKGGASFDDIARELGMSDKTLERRLAERDTSFSKLLDDIRCDLAKRYLVDTDSHLGQLAYLLGYSEPAVLVRAFRRWTGTTPMQFRDRAR
jgi:AraC-like DNA-binding protein